jgi:hypothetical protein
VDHLPTYPYTKPGIDEVGIGVDRGQLFRTRIYFLANDGLNGVANFI